jgi:hypothetical protein
MSKASLKTGSNIIPILYGIGNKKGAQNVLHHRCLRRHFRDAGASG